jgi:hypothetical protein
MAINDCKQRTRDAQMIRLSLRNDVRRNADCGDSNSYEVERQAAWRAAARPRAQCPSGVRTPNQLSRTC